MAASAAAVGDTERRRGPAERCIWLAAMAAAADWVALLTRSVKDDPGDATSWLGGGKEVVSGWELCKWGHGKQAVWGLV